jgi:hypothetical protein
VTDDVHDVLRELANMIGGNIKSAVAAGLSLSLPWVTEGSAYGRRLCGTEIQDRLAFDCEDGPFWVTLLAVPLDTQGAIRTPGPCQETGPSL